MHRFKPSPRHPLFDSPRRLISAFPERFASLDPTLLGVKLRGGTGSKMGATCLFQDQDVVVPVVLTEYAVNNTTHPILAGIQRVFGDWTVRNG